MKIYKWFWTHEGFCWRRKNYVILKPTETCIVWKLRRIGGESGCQKVEREDNYKTEKEAFLAGNKAVKSNKHKNTQAK